ncbi:MAG: amylo-alpha-1,6-glucosidase [Terriglobia bacterium]
MDDIIQVKDQYYILSTSSLADDRTHVLKEGETFGVFDRRGDIVPVGRGALGLYHEDTRFLSRWALRLGDERPLLLSSAVRDDNALLVVDLTNPDIQSNDQVVVPRGTLHISRSKFIWKAAHYEEIRITNYSPNFLDMSFSIRVAADFADIFEVRGMHRERRGRALEEQVDNNGITFGYRGLDNVIRRTRVHCSPEPDQVSASEISLAAPLKPKGQISYRFVISCFSGERQVKPPVYATAATQSMRSLQRARTRKPEIYTTNEQCNDWLNRSAADLHMMITETPHGPYPFGGVPWFSTPFGRDGIITAMETLWINPAIARGVLSYLAATQATAVCPEVDAEPGKILHETRKGEMAALKEVPFGRYYGSIDSTPLFVMLAGAYYHRTGDTRFIKQIWPHIESALQWIDRYGDSDGDGFVEYSRCSKEGLVNQGWKDSSDAIFHSDGSPAIGPIALCEVQGYVYAAKRRAAELAALLGRPDRARRLLESAKDLRRRFESTFWCEDLSTYALALDGKKKPCCVRASNAGHCLFTGIAGRARAKRVAETLLGNDFFSGWGVRTVSSKEDRYNAMSYHNGSVWPHDNALIASGLARYGIKHAALKSFTGLLDASIFVELHRLPELFCGFDRRPGEGPTLYPVACTPQSWAAAAAFLMLQACLGIVIRGSPPLVLFRRTILPESLPEIEIRNLQVGSAMVNLAIHRAGDGINVAVLKKEGDVDVVCVS